MKKFLTGIFSEADGSPSWKRIAGMILLLLYVSECLFNNFLKIVLEPSYVSILDSTLKTLIAAIVIEKIGMALSNKDNDKPTV